MSNYKIIKTNDPYPDVLIHRNLDDDQNDTVRILAFGVIDAEEDGMWIEDIVFENNFMPGHFINDFSQASAEAWCREHGMQF